MKLKAILATLLIISLAFTGVGCAGWWDEEVSNTGSSGETQRMEAKHTEQNHARLVTTSPPPTLTNSLERENLINRLAFMNDRNSIMYLTLFSNDGNVIGTFVMDGKVSSVNSKLTTSEQIIESPFVDTYNGAAGNYGMVVESPALDGSYGSNGDAIFGFDTNIGYIEWNGLYLITEQPWSPRTMIDYEMAI